MRTEQLEYLQEISMVKSMNKASKNLCISVQALQTSMKNLEQELGFQIFDSTYKGTQLTEKGSELLDAWIQFKNKIKSLQEKPKGIYFLTGKVSIVCVPGVVETILPRFFVEMQKYHPNVELDIISVYYKDIMREILLENIEYALVFAPKVKGEYLINWEERFEYVSLKKLKMYCALNAKMKLAEQKKISLSTMLQHDIICLEPEVEKIFSNKEIIHAYDPAKNITVVKHKKIYDELLKTNNFVALSASIDGDFSDTNGIVYVPILDDSITAELGYVKLKNKDLSSESQLLLSMLYDFLRII